MAGSCLKFLAMMCTTTECKYTHTNTGEFLGAPHRKRHHKKKFYKKIETSQKENSNEQPVRPQHPARQGMKYLQTHQKPRTKKGEQKVKLPVKNKDEQDKIGYQ